MNEQDQKIIEATAEQLNYEAIIASYEQRYKFILHCLTVKDNELRTKNIKIIDLEKILSKKK